MPTELKPFQTRVVEEKAELDEKITKLTTFLEKNANELPPDEEPRMRLQLQHMQAYSGILAERIANFV